MNIDNIYSEHTHFTILKFMNTLVRFQKRGWGFTMKKKIYIYTELSYFS